MLTEREKKFKKPNRNIKYFVEALCIFYISERMDLRDGIKQINFKSQALFFLKKNFSVLMFYILFGKKLYVNCLESKTIYLFRFTLKFIKCHTIQEQTQIFMVESICHSPPAIAKKTNKINLNTQTFYFNSLKRAAEEYFVFFSIA